MEKLKGKVKTIPAHELKHKQLVGAGSFGKVYKAQWGKKVVAVKVPKPSAREEDVREEVEMLAKLKHKNIVQLHGISHVRDQGANRIAVVLEYVKDNLEDMLGSVDSIKVCQGIIAAMVYVHGKKLIHRDLKPENVLIGEDSTAKVIDFGLSRTLAQNFSGLATKGVGTPYYQAPEVAGEKPVKMGSSSSASTSTQDESTATTATTASAGSVIRCSNGRRRSPSSSKSSSSSAKCTPDSDGPDARYSYPADVFSFGKILNDLAERNAGTPREVVEIAKACTRADPSARPTFFLLEKQFKKLHSHPQSVPPTPATGRGEETTDFGTTTGVDDGDASGAFASASGRGHASPRRGGHASPSRRGRTPPRRKSPARGGHCSPSRRDAAASRRSRGRANSQSPGVTTGADSTTAGSYAPRKRTTSFTLNHSSPQLASGSGAGGRLLSMFKRGKASKRHTSM